MPSLERYCSDFCGSDQAWPDLPLPRAAQDLWWAEWITQRHNQRQHSAPLDALREHLPQLWITPQRGAASSELYRRLVLQGEAASPADQRAGPQLEDPAGITISLAPHPCGSIPVIHFRSQTDFVLAVRCLAHRCEPVSIQATVHAQAVAGLIHWGLIRDIGREQRCQLLMLHEAPYSSLPASCIPGDLSDEDWIERSRRWRLEHELTHIACKRLVGEMRINLFDELIADALGMLAALGQFKAALFLNSLGLNADGGLRDDARAHVYLQTLDPQHHTDACQMVIARAQELEALLHAGSVSHEPMQLLRVLTHNRLDQPLQPNP